MPVDPRSSARVVFGQKAGKQRVGGSRKGGSRQTQKKRVSPCCCTLIILISIILLGGAGYLVYYMLYGGGGAPVPDLTSLPLSLSLLGTGPRSLSAYLSLPCVDAAVEYSLSLSPASGEGGDVDAPLSYALIVEALPDHASLSRYDMYIEYEGLDTEAGAYTATLTCSYSDPETPSVVVSSVDISSEVTLPESEWVVNSTAGERERHDVLQSDVVSLDGGVLVLPSLLAVDVSTGDMLCVQTLDTGLFICHYVLSVADSDTGDDTVDVGVRDVALSDLYTEYSVCDMQMSVTDTTRVLSSLSSATVSSASPKEAERDIVKDGTDTLAGCNLSHSVSSLSLSLSSGDDGEDSTAHLSLSLCVSVAGSLSMSNADSAPFTGSVSGSDTDSTLTSMGVDVGGVPSTFSIVSSVTPSLEWDGLAGVVASATFGVDVCAETPQTLDTPDGVSVTGTLDIDINMSLPGLLHDMSLSMAPTLSLSGEYVDCPAYTLNGQVLEDGSDTFTVPAGTYPQTQPGPYNGLSFSLPSASNALSVTLGTDPAYLEAPVTSVSTTQLTLNGVAAFPLARKGGLLSLDVTAYPEYPGAVGSIEINVLDPILWTLDTTSVQPVTYPYSRTSYETVLSVNNALVLQFDLTSPVGLEIVLSASDESGDHTTYAVASIPAPSVPCPFYTSDTACSDAYTTYGCVWVDDTCLGGVTALYGTVSSGGVGVPGCLVSVLCDTETVPTTMLSGEAGEYAYGAEDIGVPTSSASDTACTLEVSMGGYETYTEVVSAVSLSSLPMLVDIPLDQCSEYTLSGTLFDAVTSSTLSGILYTVKRVQAVDGEWAAASGATGIYGEFSTSWVPVPGSTYTVSFEDPADSYAAYTEYLEYSGCSLSMAYTLVSSVTLDDSVTIVLSWGELNTDLDGVLTTPWGCVVGSGSGQYKQCDDEDTGSSASLDHDASGHYGIETITVADRGSGGEGGSEYIYTVSVYTGTTPLYDSDAQVVLSSGTRTVTYRPTQSTCSSNGLTWTLPVLVLD
ncbi:hypothetical protein KIPB_006249 [Kipferlia bialata]|uniref:Uncharacterized protein n=1 Tax=Kipferlia bialata TaxID=797122 RepID=A0A9K3GJP4_9EUKA|nr:hypothetical protein KIPB_006249 [Kipferlia bialata]|eukprot:g6249.t1